MRKIEEVLDAGEAPKGDDEVIEEEQPGTNGAEDIDGVREAVSPFAR